MKKTFQQTIKRITSKPDESLHPLTVFYDWLDKQIKKFLTGLAIFILGMIVGGIIW